jgi:GH25 family lysozyme M1 (1,4-beta-N-acetylmuramidase)
LADRLVSITLADVSEFQQNVDAPAYLQGGHSCIIARAHNGNRPDRIWPARRDYLRKHPFDAIGYYQYLVAGRDANAQAHDFISTVGDIRENEFVILDLEEGSGNQTPRAQAWFAVVDAHYGRPSTLYSGESFGDTNLGGWSRWTGRPRWMAAYQGHEPNEPHDLWQNTDRAHFPGIGTCDGNIFHGTGPQFAHIFCHMTGPAPIPPHPPLPKPIKEGTVIAPAVKPDGRIELFYEADDGEVLHTWQPQPNSGWAGAEKGKRYAGWQSMGYPQKARM